MQNDCMHSSRVRPISLNDQSITNSIKILLFFLKDIHYKNFKKKTLDDVVLYNGYRRKMYYLKVRISETVSCMWDYSVLPLSQ